MPKILNDNQRSKTTTNTPKIQKNDDLARGGYGYIKRRLGLLSHEIDKLKEDPNPKKDSH